LEGKVLSGADMHAPQITREVKNDQKPWITPGIKTEYII
jgi:hypothetical protein